MNDGLRHFVVVKLDDRRFALPLDGVDRVVRAVEITPLPGSLDGILGVIDVHGRIVPVVELRGRWGCEPAPMRLDDLIVIAHADRRPVAMVVDWADVVEWPADTIEPVGPTVPGCARFREVAKRPDGLVPVCDVNTLLSAEDDRALDGAMGTKGGGA